MTADIGKIITLKIAKLGYYGGDPQKVRNAYVGDVMSILDYENFNNQYESTEYVINSPK